MVKNIKLWSTVKDTVYIIIGIFSAAMGLKGFLLSSKFIDGGVTGVSMLIADTTDFPVYYSIILLNLPFIWVGFRRLGSRFALKSILAIVGLSLCLAFVKFPDVTPDKLLTAVFGGFFIGVGIGFAIRGGAVLDGTEIAALLVSKRMELLKVSDVILLFNVLIFALAAFFLSVESAMYSILTYITASKMIDLIINGIEQYTGVTIVSEQSEAIRAGITNLGRGVTIYQGKSGFGNDGQINTARDIIFTVATRLEIPALKRRVLEIDPQAFIVQHAIEDTTGGILKGRIGH